MAELASHQIEFDSQDALEVDSYLTDSDASSAFSDTTSLSSSALNYQYENGRRYHAYRAGKYLIPNDEVEQDRLDLMHHVWGLELGGKLYLAPLEKEKVKKVLDVGTGTGIWACDFGDEFPDAEVIGCDLSPIQPKWVPPNVRFVVDDIEDPWAYGDEAGGPVFDYIHSRTMLGSIRDWDGFLKESYRNLRPGGYVELQEYDSFNPASDDGTYTEDSAMYEYQQLLKKAMKNTGTYVDVPGLAERLQAAGFVDIVVRKFKAPVGAWPKKRTMKEHGIFMYESIKTGMEAYGLALFTRVLGMDEKKAKELIQKTVEEYGDPRKHVYGIGYVVYGRKPKA